MAWFVGGGDVANEEHLAQLKKGVKAWNEWRRTNSKVHPNLSNARFSRADLSWANLSWADLRYAHFSGADLSETILHGAQLVAADLGGANLHGAILTGAILAGADLSTADLKEAWTGYTVFADNDLSTTKGLDLVHHLAPSTIGIDTIYKSRGKIPLAFLRGCGVPESFIEYMPSLVAAGAIQFYSCFISYSTKDQEFADRLYADLQNKGVRCWFAPHDVQGGKFLDEQIDAAIRMHEKVLLILSPDSIIALG
jgi:hypothetical protein